MTTSEPSVYPAVSVPEKSIGIYVVFGFILAIAAITSHFLAAGPLGIPLSEETLRLLRDESNRQSQDAAKVQVYANEKLNCGVLLTLLLGMVGAGFGILEGVRIRRAKRGVMGGLLGLLIGGAMGWIVGPSMRDLQHYLVSQLFDGITNTIIIHGLTWGMCGIVAGIGTAIASMNLYRGGRSTITGILGAALGVLLFALVAGTMYPTARTEEFRFKDPKSRMIWASFPSLLLSLAVWRAVPENKFDEANAG